MQRLSRIIFNLVRGTMLILWLFVFQVCYTNTNLKGVLIRPETSYNQYQLINSNGLAGSITLSDNSDNVPMSM